MITVRYSCDVCGVTDRPLQVPARETESIEEWMDLLARCIKADHSSVSPRCECNKVSNLKIPVPKQSEFIGQQIE